MAVAPSTLQVMLPMHLGLTLFCLQRDLNYMQMGSPSLKLSISLVLINCILTFEHENSQLIVSPFGDTAFLTFFAQVYIQQALLIWIRRASSFGFLYSLVPSPLSSGSLFRLFFCLQYLAYLVPSLSSIPSLSLQSRVSSVSCLSIRSLSLSCVSSASVQTPIPVICDFAPLQPLQSIRMDPRILPPMASVIHIGHPQL